MSPPKTKCKAVSADGHPCKAWAIHGSNPPRCAPHSGLTGAPIGSSNALTHGYYQRQIKPEEQDILYESAADVTLVQEAALLRVLLHRLSNFLSDPELPLEKVKSIGPLIVSSTRALVLVQQHLPDPNALDMDAILDELGEKWDWDI